METKFRTSSILLFCLVLLLLSPVTFGQIGSKHAIGVEGGAGVSFLRGLENIEEYFDPAFCYTVGASYQYSFSEKLSLFTGLSYERKGSVAKAEAIDQSGDFVAEIISHVNYDYLLVPLLVRFSFGSKTKLYINGGPYTGFLLKSTSVTEENDIIPYTKLDITDDSYRYDFGISAGIGVRIPINAMIIFTAEVRNNLGLVNTRSATIEEEGGSVKMNATNLILGLNFPL